MILLKVAALIHIKQRFQHNFASDLPNCEGLQIHRTMRPFLPLRPTLLEVRMEGNNLTEQTEETA
jgi:hypothetical protein